MIYWLWPVEYCSPSSWMAMQSFWTLAGIGTCCDMSGEYAAMQELECFTFPALCAEQGCALSASCKRRRWRMNFRTTGLRISTISLHFDIAVNKMYPCWLSHACPYHQPTTKGPVFSQHWHQQAAPQPSVIIAASYPPDTVQTVSHLWGEHFSATHHQRWVFTR